MIGEQNTDIIFSDLKFSLKMGIGEDYFYFLISCPICRSLKFFPHVKYLTSVSRG